MNIKKTIVAAGTALAFGLPAIAQAQPAPGYATQGEQIRGTIASIGGKYTVYVRDQRGFVDTVQLHDGTIINPTGLTLASGQSVTILGRTEGHAFDADEIDTPYNIDDGAAYANGPVVVEPYAYGAYDPAYALAYPAYIGLNLGFGGYYGRGYYGGGYYGHGGYYGRGGYYGNGYNGYRGAPAYRGSVGVGFPLGSTRTGSPYGGGATRGFGASRGPSAASHASSGGGSHH